MDDELNLDNIEADTAKKVEIKNRYQQLSEKVIVTSKERDDAIKAKGESDAKIMAAEKERDFFKSFSQISSKHPEAANYQDQILERVNKGYDPEEAALAVLAKEGKLGNLPIPTAKPVDVIGGSAATVITGNKPFNEMTMDDKKAELSKLSNDELAKAFRQ